jgi:GNAT superfamily N-acetyltransferase
LPGLEITQIDSFDGSFAAFWDRVQHRFPVMVVRDPTYLNWRFIDVPMREYKAFAARSEGEVRGFVALRATTLGQFSAGLIADLLVEDSAEGRAAGRLLIDQAYSYFRDRDVDILASLALHHTDEFRLQFQGFCKSQVLQPRSSVWSCAVTTKKGPSRVAYELRNWFVTLGDFDVG